MTEFVLVGYASLLPVHLDDCAALDDLKIMSHLCGELYFVNCVRHVRGMLWGLCCLEFFLGKIVM